MAKQQNDLNVIFISVTSVGQEIHPREYSPMKMTVVLVVRHEGRHGTYSTAFKAI